MHPRKIVARLPLLTLIVCVALCVSAMGGPEQRRGADRDDDAIHTLAVGELQRDFAGRIGQRVRFTFQFESAPRDWNPYLTRFGTREYSAAVGWGDGQLLWQPEEFANPTVLLFARRGSDASAVLEGGRTYTRYEVVGRVVQVFLGLPWIEVESAQRLPEETCEGAILHVTRALRFMANQQWNHALDDLARAEVSNLPAPAREELARLRVQCQLALEAR